MRRDVCSALLYQNGRQWRLLLHGSTTSLPSIDVTGRSLRHVDRLARDWIGSGVSPTKTGGRGVWGKRWWDAPTFDQEILRAREEDRARRVVRR
jgi:hypothetical protein